MVSIPKVKLQEMEKELQILRNSRIYQRLLEFEENIKQEKFTRKDLGF